MIAFLTLCYAAIIWLIFFKLRLLPWTRTSQAGAVGIGIVGVLALVISMNLFQPYSDDVRVYRTVIQIVPRVTGRIIDVPIRPQERIEEGQILFHIDPQPFQHQVSRLEADLRLKGIVLQDAKALTGAQVAAKIKLDRAQANFDQAKATLAEANWQLSETTVYAPADGIVTELALRPGHMATSASTMNFIVMDQMVVAASFSQSAITFVTEGDAVEVVLDRYPGEVLDAVVSTVVPGTGQGQLLPNQTLLEWTDTEPAGRFGVLLTFDEEAVALAPEAGAAGSAAVYTDRGKAIRIIRKVVMRMQTWLNYLNF